MELPEAQVAVLQAASASDEQSIDELAVETDRKPETVTGAAFALEEAGLVAIAERERAGFELTPEGERYREAGLPEVRLYRAAVEAGADVEPVSMGELTDAAGLAGETVQIALSNFARKGYGRIDSGAVAAAPDADPDGDPEAAALDAVAGGEAAGVDEAVLDIGLNTPSPGAKVFSVQEGAIDAGLDCPHNESVFPDWERTRGVHIAEYAEERGGLYGGDFDATDLPEHFDAVLETLREEEV